MWQESEGKGLKYFLSTNPPIRIIFTTRQGGFSKGNYRFLNLSPEVGEEMAIVQKNYQKLKEVLGIERIATLKQVHSDRLLFVRDERSKGKGDALLTKEKNLYLGVKVADCLAVAFFTQKGEIIGIAHIGWRNALFGFPKKIAQILKKETNSPIFYTLLPSIQGRCYQVGKEVFLAFQKGYPEIAKHFLGEEDSQYQLDLRTFTRLLLNQEGLEEYPSLEGCVHCQPELFYSKRRDGITGRNLALIGILG